MDLLDLLDGAPGPPTPDQMTDLDWAIACEDYTYHWDACDHCPGCHAQRCNRTADGQVLDPKKPSVCEGPPGQPHPETLVHPGGRCPTCRRP